MPQYSQTTTTRASGQDQFLNTIEALKGFGQVAGQMGGLIVDAARLKQQDALIKQEREDKFNFLMLEKGLESNNFALARDSGQKLYPGMDINPQFDLLEKAYKDDSEQAQESLASLKRMYKSRDLGELIFQASMHNTKHKDWKVPIDNILSAVGPEDKAKAIESASQYWGMVYDDAKKKIQGKKETFINNPGKLNMLNDLESRLDQMIQKKEFSMENFVQGNGYKMNEVQEKEMRILYLDMERSEGMLSDEKMMEYTELKGWSKTPEQYALDIEKEKAEVGYKKRQTELLDKPKKDKSLENMTVDGLKKVRSTILKNISGAGDNSFKELLAEMSGKNPKDLKEVDVSDYVASEQERLLDVNKILDQKTGVVKDEIEPPSQDSNIIESDGFIYDKEKKKWYKK